MDLFKLLGTIAVDNAAAKQALQETTSEAKKTAEGIEEAGNSGDGAGSKLGAVFGGIGKAAVACGKVVATGLAAGAGAVTALVTKSVQSYADYEQLVGGVETLFKDSAVQVQEYAKNAYKTAGLSANEYMETVTSFSASLLQSLDGDTKAAAEKANMAITDMSDNANKMGTDMALIQNAYNGFAKANYTMLDNLKLGYGGTKEEMARLLADAQAISGIEYDISSYADVVDAIHVIQTEMGITGTTAKEASSTISGSIQSMKSSWQNLLTAISSDDLPFEDYVNSFVESTATVVDNLLPRIETALGGVVSLIDKLAPIITAKIPELFASLLPSLLSAASSLLLSVVRALTGLIYDALPPLLDGITQTFTALMDQLPIILDRILEAVTLMIPELVNCLVSVITTLAAEIPNILEVLVTYIPWMFEMLVEAILNSLPLLVSGIEGLIVGLVEYLPVIVGTLVDMVINIMTMLVEQLPVIIPMLVSAITNIIATVAEQLPVILPQLVNAVVTIVGMLVEQLPVIIPMLIDATITIVMALINALPGIIQALVDALPAILQAVWDAIIMVFENLPAWFGQLWDGVNAITGAAWDAIKKSISSVLDFLKNHIVNTWNNVKNATKAAWDGIKGALSATWTGIKTVVSTAIEGVKSTVSTSWDKIKNITTTVWEGIKNAITKPIEAAKDKIRGIIDTIKGFFSNFKITLPDIKLPHFSISPSGWKLSDLLEGSIPKLGIEWYAQAMRNPMIMDEPTVFGYNAATGRLQGGGEAGSEVVSGTNTLMNMIGAVVEAKTGTQMERMVSILTALLEAIVTGNSELLKAILAGQVIKLDGREFGRTVREYA